MKIYLFIIFSFKKLIKYDSLFNHLAINQMCPKSHNLTAI